MAYIQIPAFSKSTNLNNDDEFVIVVDGKEYLVSFKTLSEKFGNSPELLQEINAEIEALRNIVDAFPSENPAAPIALKIADTPTIDGIYKPTETGVYPNAGGLEYDPTEGITYFIRTQGVWTKDVTPVNFIPTGVVEEGNTNAVSGGEVYEGIVNYVENVLVTEFTTVANTLPLPSASTGSASLILNVPSPVDGVVSNMNIRHTTKTGIAKFRVFDRISNNYPEPITGNKEQFIGREIFTVDLLTIGTHTYNIEPPISIKEGQYLGWIMESGDLMTPCFGGTDNVPAYGRWGIPLGVPDTVVEGTFSALSSVAFNYTVFSEIDNYVKNEDFLDFKNTLDPKITRITAVKNTNNYNSIRDLIKSITDASENNRYEIFIPKGIWNEYDILPKKYVKLIGESLETTILCDGNSTDPNFTVPSDAYYVTTGAIIAGTQLSLIQKDYRHVFFATDDLDLENITVKAINCKYPFHLDNIGFKNIRISNFRAIDDNCSYAFGIGVRANQSIEIENYTIEKINAPDAHNLGIFIHNWGNQSAGTFFKANNGKHIGCGYATLSELGSGHPDIWNFNNLTTDSIGEFFVMVDPSVSGTYPDPTTVPYNIVLNTLGTTVDIVYDRPSSQFPAPYNAKTCRPEFHKYMTSDYVKEALVANDSGIIMGDIVCYANNNQPIFQKIRVKKISNANDVIAGIALENAVNGQKLKYTPLEKYAKTFISGGVANTESNYNRYKLKLNDSFQLESDLTLLKNNIIGFAFEPKGEGVGLSYSKLVK